MDGKTMTGEILWTAGAFFTNPGANSTEEVMINNPNETSEELANQTSPLVSVDLQRLVSCFVALGVKHMVKFLDEFDREYHKMPGEAATGVEVGDTIFTFGSTGKFLGCGCGDELPYWESEQL